MVDILVRPVELRQISEQLRASSKKVDTALQAIDNDILALKGDKFLGNRANSVQAHYAPKREALLKARDVVSNFAGDLETAAMTFENADKQTPDSSQPGASDLSWRTIEEVQGRIKELSSDYDKTLKEIYDLLNQATEQDKELVKNMGSLVFNGLKMYFKGEVSLLGVMGLVEKAYNSMVAMNASENLEGQATGLMNKLAGIGAELNKEQYAESYLKYEGKDIPFLNEEKGILQDLIKQNNDLKADLERLVTSWDGHGSLILGELTGQVDADALTKNYMLAMQAQRQYEMELSAVNQHITEIGGAVETPAPDSGFSGGGVGGGGGSSW